jgi:hypothetical protein
MKFSIIIVLSFCLPLFINAQTTISWKGGTPGKETKWSEPQNWDAYRIPNENDRVIIKMENSGHFSQPVINGKVHIAWLEIHSGATLEVTNSGVLLVDGTYTYSEGISMHGGKLHSEGKIILKHIDVDNIAALQPLCLDHSSGYASGLYGYEFTIVSSDKTW